MSKTMFTSDLHLGHKAILKYREGFKTIPEHDSLFLDKLSKLRKRDTVKVLGDFIFDGPHYEEYIKAINKMSCRIQLVMGNHDSLRLLKEPKIEVQLPLFTYKGYWLSHAPIHPQELRSRIGNIHGHLHGNIVLTADGEKDENYFNVCVDNNNNDLVDFDLIKEILKEK